MEVSDPLLVAARERDDMASYLVLADALTERGDLRGELVRAQCAVEQNPGDAEAMAHADALIEARFTELAGFPPVDKVLWRRGFVDATYVTAQEPPKTREAVLRALTSHPGCALMRALTLAFPTRPNELRRIFEDLAGTEATAPPSLRLLRLGAAFATHPDLRVYSDFERFDATDDLTAAWSLFPELRELTIDAGYCDLALGTLDLPQLRSFEWISPATRDLSPLLALRAPRLERLVVWTGRFQFVNWTYEAYDEGFDEHRGQGVLAYPDLQPLLELADGVPQLREFGLVNFTGPLGELAPYLSRHVAFSRIETLDLSRGRLDDLEVEPLLGAIRAMPRLERIMADDLYASNRAWQRLDEGLRDLQVELDGVQSPTPSHFTYVSAQE